MAVLGGDAVAAGGEHDAVARVVEREEGVGVGELRQLGILDGVGVARRAGGQRQVPVGEVDQIPGRPGRRRGGPQRAPGGVRCTHTLDVCEAITQVPSAKPEVVGAQIHDAEDDVLQIRLEGHKLIVQYDDGKSEQVLDPAYQLGTPYQVRIIAADGKVDILYNGEKKAELPLTGSGWYWKVGAYVQANADTGDAQSSGAVTVYALQVDHSDTAARHTHDAGTSSGTGPTSSSRAADKAAANRTDDEHDGAGRSSTPTTPESTSESTSDSGSGY